MEPKYNKLYYYIIKNENVIVEPLTKFICLSFVNVYFKLFFNHLFSNFDLFSWVK